MAPKIRSNDSRPVPGASSPPTAAHVYRRSHQGMQQIRFPSRRKIVKKYGRHDTTRFPRQQTLTQAGYAMPPPPELREDVLDLGPTEDAPSDPWTATSAAVHPHSPSPLARNRGPKRRKLRHRASEPPAAGSSFHTQTLTQFVSKHEALGSHGGADGDEPHATIRDSEDEDIFASPTALPKRPATSPKYGTEAPSRSGGLRGGSCRPSPPPPMSTPTTSRIEIPSSQPSPFTPLVDRYYSPLGRQRSSPLFDKTARRLAHPGNSRAVAVTAPTKNVSPCNGTRVGLPVTDAGGGVFEAKSQSVCTSREIPDSDEEDIGSSGPLCPSQRVAAPASYPEPARGIGNSPVISPVIEDVSSPISAPPSSPLSPLLDAWPTSPTPLPEQRQALGAEAAAGLPRAEAMRHVAITGASSTSARDEDGLDHPQVLDQQHEALTSFTCQESSIPAQEDLGMQATQPQYSQGLESQRVPLEVIRMLGPQTDRSDIIISIHPEQIRKIVSGTKDHEFLSFKIPHTVTRFWIYASRPVCELQFMAVVAAGFRQPGEIDSESGIGNADFNAGRLVAKFAYKLVQVYQLNNPVSLDVMKKNGWAGPPRRYDYLPPAIVGSLLGNLRCALFEDASEPGLDHSGSGLSEPGETPCAGSLSAGGPTAGKPGAGADAGSYYADTRVELSVSQEIEAQLLSDISDTQVSRNMQPLGLMSSQAQAATPAMPPSTSHAACRSQATTATAPATQEMPSRPTLSLQDADTTQDAELATVSRLELDLGQSSVAFARDGSGKTTSHADDADSTSQWQRGSPRPCKRPGDGRQQPSLQTPVASSNECTQAALPESLYEEVRQAPPAVILDWEDSDDEE